MNPEIKAKWIAALRSGNYKQGDNYLRFNNEFCCLGVLCDIVNPHGWSDEYELKEFTEPDGENYNVMPPKRVLNLVGLSSEQAITLSKANDAGVKFVDIADRIEAM